MSNTLGPPTGISLKARENEVLSYNATLVTSPVVANPILRYRIGATNLVDFLLDGTTPFTGGSVDGAATFNYAFASAVATGGTASLADNYQLIGRDSVVHFGGVATCTDGISVGQTINSGAVTVTAPAS